MGNATQNLKNVGNSIKSLTIDEQMEPFQRKMATKHMKMKKRLEPGTLPPSLSVELDSSTIGLFSLEMGSAGKENITLI